VIPGRGNYPNHPRDRGPTVREEDHMKKTTLKKPVALAIGAAIAGSLAMTSTAQASAFSATDLGQGYVQLAGEGSCGGDKGKEGKCGEGKCGAEKGKEGSCGGDKKAAEGKCGEGKCGADKKEGEKEGEKKPE